MGTPQRSARIAPRTAPPPPAQPNDSESEAASIPSPVSPSAYAYAEQQCIMRQGQAEAAKPGGEVMTTVQRASLGQKVRPPNSRLIWDQPEDGLGECQLVQQEDGVNALMGRSGAHDAQNGNEIFVVRGEETL